jgi:hypothetical protein
VTELEIGERRRVEAGLRVDQLEFVSAARAKGGTDLWADADPVDCVGDALRAVGLHRGLKPARLHRGQERRIHLEERLAPVKTTKRWEGESEARFAGALVAELGETHRAAKILMGWTRAGERTVKRWLAGSHGPRGDHLLVLMEHSDAVFEAVLTAINRRDAAIAARVVAATSSLEEVIRLLEAERSAPLPAGLPGGGAHDTGASSGGNDRDDDRDHDRNNDRDRGPRDTRPGASTQERQAWFLEALRDGQHVGAADITDRWKVSEKTARRDIAALKERGLVKFVGARRSGRYRAAR